MDKKLNDLDVEDVLVRFHRAIIKAAHRFHANNPRYDISDLVSEAKLAAIEATKAFDPERKVKFHTFLHRTLQNKLDKFVCGNKYDITGSYYQQKQEFHKRGNTNTVAEKSTAIRIDSGDGHMRNNIAPSGDPSPLDKMIQDENIKILMEEIEKLPQNEKEVIKMRRFEKMTLEEAAGKMNTTKECVRIWEKKGFNRIQRSVKSRLGNTLY